MIEKQTMNNAIDINEEAKKSLIECEKMIAKEIDYISKFTYKNYDELLKMIFENCGDISELEGYIEFLRQSIENNQNTIERMNNQKELTRKDIIEENAFNIYAVYSATVIGTYLLSSDPMAFVKNIIIMALIGIGTFKINLDYFTSDYHKKQIEDYLTKLNETIENDRFNIITLNKLKEMCVNELKFEVMKLYELVKKNNNYEADYKKIDEFLKEINIEVLIKQQGIKTRSRRK